MRCADIRANLSDYLDEALDPERRAEMEEHFEHCPDCRAELESLRSIVSELQRLPRVTAPEGFLAAVKERVAHDTPRQRMQLWLFSRQSWKLPLELAGVFASALLIVLTYHALQEQPAPKTKLSSRQAASQPQPAPASLKAAGVPSSPAEAPRLGSKSALMLEDAAVPPVRTLVLRIVPMHREKAALGRTEAQSAAVGSARKETESEAAPRPTALSRVTAIIHQNGGTLKAVTGPHDKTPEWVVDCAIPSPNVDRFIQALGDLGVIEDQDRLAHSKETAQTVPIRLRIVSGP